MKINALCGALRPLSVLALTVPVLTGCLVDPDKVTTNEYAVTLPAQLRVYQDQDRNEYVVSGLQINTSTGATETLFGNMFTKWENTSVYDQFNSGLITPLAETSVLTLNEVEMGRVLRYVEQTPADAVDGTGGTLFLLGINDGTPDSTTWTRDNNSGIDFTRVPMTVFWSPVEDAAAVLDTANHAQIIYLMNQCVTDPTCTPTGYLDMITHQVSDIGTQLVLTQYGRFEVYRVDYSGTFFAEYDNQAVPDIRAHCYDGSANSLVTFSGYMHIHPKVGMVRMVNSCNSGAGTTVDFTAEMTHTTIPLIPAN